MWAADERTDHRAEQVGDDVLERVRVQRRESHWRRPLVVLLVDVLVDLQRTSDMYFFTVEASITSLYIDYRIDLKLEGTVHSTKAPEFESSN